MPKRSDQPTANALRNRQKHALRNATCAMSYIVVSPNMITMLLERGFLPSDDYSAAQMEEALTMWAMVEAEEKEELMARVSNTMRRRWYGQDN